jgi:hypothetical protein
MVSALHHAGERLTSTRVFFNIIIARCIGTITDDNGVVNPKYSIVYRGESEVGDFTHTGNTSDDSWYTYHINNVKVGTKNKRFYVDYFRGQAFDTSNPQAAENSDIIYLLSIKDEIFLQNNIINNFTANMAISGNGQWFKVISVDDRRDRYSYSVLIATEQNQPMLLVD